MTWLASIFNAIAAFFNWKNSAVEQRRSEEEAAKAKAQEALERSRKLQQAIAKGDENQANARLTEIRKRHAGGKTLFVLCLLCALAGCVRTQVVYVPETDRAIRMQAPDGRPGWWLPDAIFFEILDAADRDRESTWPIRPTQPATPRLN